jgi:hypothetical protein
LDVSSLSNPGLKMPHAGINCVIDVNSQYELMN